MCPERDSNLGLSMSHRLNYEEAALTTQPLRLDNDNELHGRDSPCSSITVFFSLLAEFFIGKMQVKD